MLWLESVLISNSSFHSRLTAGRTPAVHPTARLLEHECFKQNRGLLDVLPWWLAGTLYRHRSLTIVIVIVLIACSIHCASPERRQSALRSGWHISSTVVRISYARCHTSIISIFRTRRHIIEVQTLLDFVGRAVRHESLDFLLLLFKQGAQPCVLVLKRGCLLEKAALHLSQLACKFLLRLLFVLRSRTRKH